MKPTLHVAALVLRRARHPAPAVVRYSTSNTSNPPDCIGAYTPVTSQLWKQRLASLREPLTGVGDSTVPRLPRVTRATYPFTSDATLVELYRNPWGSCRVGRLLEDIDSLSGTVAFDHCRESAPSAPPPLLVTASVDAIGYTRPISLTHDVEMTGQVVWTGRSSLDIRVQLTQGAGPPNLVATLCFVSLDPSTRRSKPVPPLAPSSPQERVWFGERQAVADERKAACKAAQTTGVAPRAPLSPAAEEELQRLLQLARAKQHLPALLESPTLAMEETATRNAFICQPQQRNLAGRVFGGFLMRRAYELAFATAYQFAGARPTFVEVADISFRHPVDVGDLLRLKAFVVHTRTGPSGGTARVGVDVEARVVRPEAVASHVSNTFTFQFQVQRPHVPTVVPASEGEATRLAAYLAEAW